MHMTKRGEFIAIDQIHESTTNPRKTFDEAKLYELGESIKHNGLIQPLTVRPNNQGFEIVAGARRFRAAQLAELFSVPARIVEIDDAQALEWQLVENSQRVDVHPYEEAQGFQRLLDIPGYDVAALVEKSGKSASHVYARLSLLQLIPAVAEAFTQERISASHANLIARLPQESQAEAFEQCWRKDWQDKEPHLLPAKHVAAWIQANLYLSLADAPFDREDPTLNPAAGACVTCPRRSGHNTSLFCDVQGDQCLDSTCYHSKVEAFLDREIAAHPGIVQIENGWRNPKEQRPGAVQRGHVREIPTVTDNPDAEPVMPCAAAKAAIVVYGKHLGRKLTVCADKHCPVHDPQATSEAADHPAPAMAPAPEAETEEEAAEREAEHEQRMAEYKAEQERKEEERKAEFERRQKEYEAEQARREKLSKARIATFERIIEEVPASFNAAQMRVFLRLLIHLDYSFLEEVATHFANGDENAQQSDDEIVLAALDGTPDEKLTSLALRLVLSDHIGIPQESQPDLLTEAEQVFAPKKPKAVKAKGDGSSKPKPAAVKAPAKKETTKKKAA
jgi:ParB family chromosome partitioning protein